MSTQFRCLRISPRQSISRLHNNAIIDAVAMRCGLLTESSQVQLILCGLSESSPKEFPIKMPFMPLLITIPIHPSA